MNSQTFLSSSPYRMPALLALAILGGLVIGYALFSPEPPDLGSEAEVNAVVAAWTCSMHPNVRQPNQGKCPICAMDLIPVSDDPDHAHGPDVARISFSPEAHALLQVQVIPIARAGSEGIVELFGQVDFNEAALTDVTLRVEGQIQRLNSRFALSRIESGHVIAEVYSPAVETASREYMQAVQSANSASRRLAEAALSQLRLFGVDEATLSALQEQPRVLDVFPVRAPVSGIVQELEVRPGTWMMPGSRIARIAPLSTVWVQFEAYETDLARLRQGQTLRFTTEALPGQTFSGTISYIDPVVDPARRTARVRVEVSNAGGQLRPGMFVRGRAASTGSVQTPLLIPTTAPLISGDRALIYVQVPGAERPTYEARSIVLGSRLGDQYEVREGLQDGDLVVIHGNFRIDAELQIRGRPSFMQPRQVQQQPTDVALPDSAAAHVRGVVTAYLNVARALSRDDFEAVQTAATRLSAAVEKASLRDVPLPVGLAWNRQQRALQRATVQLNAAQDLAQARTTLQPLTEALEAGVQALPEGTVGTLFRAFCPMAFNDRGATWLSRDDQIRNPYFGSTMFRCGEIQAQVSR